MIPHTLTPRDGIGRESPMQGGNTMGVIIIIAVFWLSGLLMTWSMCIVAARADRRMEERGRGCRPDDTSHGE